MHTHDADIPAVNTQSAQLPFSASSSEKVLNIEPIHQWQWHSKVDPTCLQSLVKLCRDRKLLFGEMFLAHHDHFHRRDHCSPHFTVGLGAGGRWALQMDTLCYTF